MVQLSHPYMTIGKTVALIRWTFVGKVMSLLFNMLFRLVIAFLPRSKYLLISLLFSKQRVGRAAKGLDDNNDSACPKLGSLRWCLGHKMLIRKFPWDQQLWGQEQKGQRSACDSPNSIFSHWVEMTRPSLGNLRQAILGRASPGRTGREPIQEGFPRLGNEESAEAII